ncbi:hypothetical protein MMC14_003702 [Varicellaria rhodocarpa]|nr:hypothetical protein [Varicellaria rhodocarpa]
MAPEITDKSPTQSHNRIGIPTTFEVQVADTQNHHDNPEIINELLARIQEHSDWTTSGMTVETQDEVLAEILDRIRYDDHTDPSMKPPSLNFKRPPAKHQHHLKDSATTNEPQAENQTITPLFDHTNTMTSDLSSQVPAETQTQPEDTTTTNELPVAATHSSSEDTTTPYLHH